MGIQLAQEKATNNTPESICSTCANAVPQLCAFIKARPKEAESVLTAMGVEAVKYIVAGSRDRFYVNYRLSFCPNYTPDNLPSMSELKKELNLPSGTAKKHDLSCPYCGNASGVKVAWAAVLPPEEWYCRCIICNKSFRPKKKEAKEDMTLREDFYKVMTKEKYLELRAQGITSDAKVLEAMGLPYNSHIKFLVEAKKQWGIPGKWVEQENKPKPDKPTGSHTTTGPEDRLSQAPELGEAGEYPVLPPFDDTEKTCEPVQDSGTHCDPPAETIILKVTGGELRPEGSLPMKPLEEHGWTAQKVDSQEPQEPQVPLISVMEAIKLHDQLEDDLVKLDEVRAGIVGRMNRIREVLEGTMVAV